MQRPGNKSGGIYDLEKPEPLKFVDQESIAGKKDSVSSKSIAFYVLILVFVIAVGAVLLIMQHFETATASDQAEIPKVSTPSVFQTSQVKAAAPVSNPSARFAIHELAGFDPLDANPEESVVMDVNWLQQTAWHLNQAERYYLWKDWRDALNEFRNAERIFPGLPGLQERIGLCLFWLEEYGKAAEAFRQEVKMTTGSPGIFNNLGLAYMFEERYADAEESFEAAVRLNEDYGAAYLNMGIMYFHQSKMNEAANAFREYLRLEPNDAEGIHYFSLALMRAERWSEAEIVLNSAIIMMPEIPALYFRLAEVKARKGEGDAAMQSISSGIELVDPKSALTWLSQGSYDALRQRQDYQNLVAMLTDLL